MRRMFHTTTALLASLSLVVPAMPASAQDAVTCADGSATPCLPGQEPKNADGTPVEGTTMTEEQAAARAAAEADAAKAAADAQAAADAAAKAQADADTAAKAQADADAAAAQKAADEAVAQKAADQAAADKAAADQAAADQAAAEKAAAEQADAEKAAAEQAAADKAAADKAAADKAAADQAAADKAAADQAAADAKAADEAAAKAQEDADAAAKAAETATAEEKAAADAAAQKAADDAAAAALKAQEEAAAAAQAKAEADAAANAEAAKAALEATQDANTAAPAPDATGTAAATDAAPAADAQQAAETAAPVTEEELAKTLTEQLGLAPDGTAGATAEAAAPAPELPVQPDAASGAAPVAEAAALPADAGAADAATAPDATVVDEVVTKDQVRSSDQDFANKVNVTAAEAVAETLAAPAAAASAAAPQKKKDRLSDLEKALLIGLGAVAVGAIISNNRKVELNSGDRVVVTRDDGSYQVIKDDDTLLRQPGSRVRTERFNDGSSRTTVLREDGSKIVTIRDSEYRVLRRVLVERNGRQTLLIDDTVAFEPVDVTTLPPPARQPVIRDTSDELALRMALEREANITRRFSLSQVRNIAQVRALVPVIDLDSITFETGSAAITPDQAKSLSSLGALIQDYIATNPREIFLVEGHTDAVGGAAYNLALSDRRAESVALALTEYFDVPPENLIVQGYGEEFLKVPSQGDVRENRRASVRRITDLLRTAAAE